MDAAAAAAAIVAGVSAHRLADVHLRGGVDHRRGVGAAAAVLHAGGVGGIVAAGAACHEARGAPPCRYLLDIVCASAKVPAAAAAAITAFAAAIAAAVVLDADGVAVEVAAAVSVAVAEAIDSPGILAAVSPVAAVMVIIVVVSGAVVLNFRTVSCVV